MRFVNRRFLAVISSFDYFSTYVGGRQLRPYQLEAAEAVIRSVLAQDGETFVWKFARQGGKDETLALLYQYLMALFAHEDISIIAAAPTYKPQTEIAIQRLDARLSRNLVLQKEFKRRSGHIYRVRKARTIFCSAHPTAQVVGLTAWPLLVINEAQDVLPAIYDKRFAPMAAAHNATRLFSGTAWTSDTLLAREEHICRLKQEQDGKRRIFMVSGPDIALVHPPYGMFLESEMTRLGANHPIVLSQYLCREIDAQSGMFTPARLAMIFSDTPPHFRSTENGEGKGVGQDPANTPVYLRSPENGDGTRQSLPAPAHFSGRSQQGGVGPIINPQSTINNAIAFLIDVAGMDEALNNLDGLGNPGRDSTALSIVEIDLSTLPTLQAPTYRVVHREAWTGLSHLTVLGKLEAMAEQWRPQHIVIDATGVGEGMWSFLDKTFPTRLIPVKFTQQEKSEIGWRFLSIIETGRFRISDQQSALSDQVRIQYAKCRSEILPGPAKTLRWGVPDGTRGPDGELVHDDHVMADALVAKLDVLDWHFHSPTLIVPARDPLDDMSRIR